MTHNPHIAVLAFPFGTHAAPLLAVVRRLSASSPGVRFSFFSSASSNAALFSAAEAHEFENIKAYDVWDGAPVGHNFAGNFQKPVEFFLKASPENFKKGIEEAEADAGVKVDGLLTDAFLWFAGEMAEEMGVSWVPFWTAGACSLSVHMYTDLIRRVTGTSGMLENGETNLKFIPGMSALQISDLPGEVCPSNLESPFAVMVHKMGLMLPNATAVVVNSFEELDPTITKDLKSKLQNFLNIGPSTLSSPPPPPPDQNGCLLWLNNHKVASVAYISFGTISTPPPSELAALAAALEDSKIPFLWSLRDNAQKLLPQGFVERTKRNGFIVSWAPQLEVLAHASIGTFVTHCGWNSVLESISYSVPMICRPFFGDQTLNCRMVEDVWKIGVRVEGGVFTKSGMISALDLILWNEKGKGLRENVGVLKEKAVKAVGLNGSSTQNFKTLKDIVTSCKRT